MPNEINPPTGKGIKRTVIRRSKSNPMLLVLGASQKQQVLSTFDNQPHITNYAEFISNQELDYHLKGAADVYDYLDKTDPVTEKQLKALFPRATATLMKDPLKQVDKTIIHDNIRREGNTKRALLFLAHFILGREPTQTLDVNRSFATEERRQEELDAIKANEEYLTILESIMDRDEMVDIHTRLVELLVSGHGYGRSILVKQYDSKGYPCELIPFSSTRLGRVYVDKKTHKFLGVEYLDYPSNSRILLAKDIIHYEVDDYLISPNSRYYGMPSGESSMYLAQANRQANEIAKPEIMARMYAPIMLVKVMSKSEEKLREIEQHWRQGKTIFYNDDIEVQVVAIPHDLEKLTNTVMENAKQIFRDATVPLGVAFQDEQNRATMEGSMIQWYEGTLQFKRTQLNNVMWRQWYKPQLEIIFEERNASRVSEVGGVYNYLMQKAMNQNETDIPFRISMTYKNIRTTGFLDTTAAVLAAYDKRLLTDDMARDEVGFGRYNSDMKDYNKKKVMMGMTSLTGGISNNMFSQQQNQMTQGQTQSPTQAVSESGGTSLGLGMKGLPNRSSQG